MSAWKRWGVFNVVGALGMAVQLLSLAALRRLLSGHYMWATAFAIELTLLHNFVWHWNYTWTDRKGAAQWWPAMLRFHVANGAVSMLGNLVLMRLLVGSARMPVLAANAVAILCCSVANFRVGEQWVFGARSQPCSHNVKSSVWKIDISGKKNI